MEIDNRKLTFTLLGNNSGRNLGDAAILSAILAQLSKKFPNADFLVPSTHPHFIDKNYGHLYPVKGVNVMPWTFSIRLFGIPTIRAIAKSDAALICDGIIFGKGFWNPAFNFLITLYLLLPFFKLFKCKLICYNCGIGPFPVPFSRYAARKVMNAASLVTLRDQDSVDLAKELGVTNELIITGDSAFINPVSSEERGKEVIEKEGLDPARPILGINITVYIDSWLEPNERVGGKEKLLQKIADAVNELAKSEEVKPLIFSTQPMDEAISNSLKKMINAPIIDNTRYLSHDIQAAMHCTELLIGMRFHALVLASAVGVPILGMIYAPKVRGYLRLLKCPEYGLELKDVANGKLTPSLKNAWQNRHSLKQMQQETVAQLISGAKNSVELLAEKI